MKLCFFISICALLVEVRQSYSIQQNGDVMLNNNESKGNPKGTFPKSFNQLDPEKVALMKHHFEVLTDVIKDMPLSLIFQYFLELTRLDPKLGKLNQLMNDVNNFIPKLQATIKIKYVDSNQIDPLNEPSLAIGSGNTDGGVEMVANQSAYVDGKKIPPESDIDGIQFGEMQSLVENVDDNSHQAGIVPGKMRLAELETEADQMGEKVINKEDRGLVTADTNEVEADAESLLRLAEQEYNEAKAAAEASYKNASEKWDEEHKKSVEEFEMMKSKALEWKQKVDAKFEEAVKKANDNYDEILGAAEAKMKKAKSEYEEMYEQGKKELEETKNKAVAEKNEAEKKGQQALNRSNGSPKIKAKFDAFIQKVEAKYAKEMEMATQKWEQVQSEAQDLLNEAMNEYQQTVAQAETDRDMMTNEVTKFRNDSADKYQQTMQEVSQNFENIEALFRQKKEAIKAIFEEDMRKANEKLNEMRNRVPSELPVAPNAVQADLEKGNIAELVEAKGDTPTENVDAEENAKPVEQPANVSAKLENGVSKKDTECKPKRGSPKKKHPVKSAKSAKPAKPAKPVKSTNPHP